MISRPSGWIEQTWKNEELGQFWVICGEFPEYIRVLFSNRSSEVPVLFVYEEHEFFFTLIFLFLLIAFRRDRASSFAFLVTHSKRYSADRKSIFFSCTPNLKHIAFRFPISASVRWCPTTEKISQHSYKSGTSPLACSEPFSTDSLFSWRSVSRRK